MSALDSLYDKDDEKYDPRDRTQKRDANRLHLFATGTIYVTKDTATEDDDKNASVVFVDYLTVREMVTQFVPGSDSDVLATAPNTIEFSTSVEVENEKPGLPPVSEVHHFTYHGLYLIQWA